MHFDSPSRIATIAWYVLLMVGLPAAVGLVLLRDSSLPLAEWFLVVAAGVPLVLLLLALLGRFVASRVEFDPEERTMNSGLVVFGLPLGRRKGHRFDEIEQIEVAPGGDEQVTVTLIDGSSLRFAAGGGVEEAANRLRALVHGPRRGDG